MVKINCSCVMGGVEFHPFSIARHMLPTDDFSAHSAGEIATEGYHKGKPYPSGRMFFDASPERIAEFIEAIGDLEKIGIEYINVCLNVAYNKECVFDLSPDLAARFSRLDITLCVTCYECDE